MAQTDLISVPSMELYHELAGRRHHAVVLWNDADVYDMFWNNYDHEPSDEEVESVWQDFGGFVEERMTQEGWDVLRECCERVLDERGIEYTCR